MRPRKLMLTLQQITFFQMAVALHDFITIGDLTFQNEENFFRSTESRYNSILVTFWRSLAEHRNTASVKPAIRKKLEFLTFTRTCFCLFMRICYTDQSLISLFMQICSKDPDLVYLVHAVLFTGSRAHQSWKSVHWTLLLFEAYSTFLK